jgi:hypothetical protein
MSLSPRRIVWCVVLVIYVGLVLGFYFAGMGGAVMFLTMPWSIVVLFFGFLLIHVSTIDLETYFLIGGFLNSLLISIGIFGGSRGNKLS